MLKVFLVEDESIVREGLRDNIPWQQYNYEFVGEASDGEIALPLIRKLKPDVLITDIKMPFMDGLALSRILVQELPEIKIIIISGYDDFEYARQALNIGVEQFLLKPITRSALQKTLLEVREKIEGERAQKDYLNKFQNEMHDYEQYSRRRFFERVFAGILSVQEIYEEAQKLSIDITASSYNLVMICLREKQEAVNGGSLISEIYERYQEEILRYFLRFPEYLIFRWDISTYGILVKGEAEEMEELIGRCTSNVKRICELPPGGLDWYVVAGTTVERLSLLPEVYQKVNHLLSYRFLLPNQHILTDKDLELLPGSEDKGMNRLETIKVDPELIQRFLKEGKPEEIEDFVTGYIDSLAEAIKSKMFRDYLILSVRFSTIAFAEKLGYSQEELFPNNYTDSFREAVIGEEEIRAYLLRLLEQVITLRDKESEQKSRKLIKTALEYIEDHYHEEDFALNMAAEAVHVSANYFSAVFSQEMQVTFIEYVTAKRMEKAKKLLRQSAKTSREIAGEVGYKDAHYFSFVFKKTQECTPREYRSRSSESAL